jgi:hypothetical protein
MKKNNARNSYERGLSHLIMDCRVKPGNDSGEAAFSFGRLIGKAQASPEVSNMAASSAARAGLPAQTTNWNAGK